LYCYYEIVHLSIHTLQKLVSGSKSLAKVIIDFHLIPNDTSERGLIFVEIFPFTTLLAVVERIVGFVPP
jgi:hypothetical protein